MENKKLYVATGIPKNAKPVSGQGFNDVLIPILSNPLPSEKAKSWADKNCNRNYSDSFRPV